MDGREQFKLATILGLADAGVVGPALDTHLAAMPAAAVKLAFSFGDAALASITWPAMAATGLGAVAGAGLGYGASKLTEEPADIENVKMQELIDTYRLHTNAANEQIRAKRQQLRARQNRPGLSRRPAARVV